MHHIVRRQLPRLLVFVLVALLCATALHWHRGPGLHEAASDPVADVPRAAARALEPSVAPDPHPGTLLTPRRAPGPATIDRKNLKDRQALPVRRRVPHRTVHHTPRHRARSSALSMLRRAVRTVRRPAPRPAPPGQDISWPQCPRGLGEPMPHPTVRFLVIGLTNGHSFQRNPCLAGQLAWARTHHVWTAAYAFTTFPRDWQIRRLGRRGPYDGRQWLGRVQNAAWRTARFNVSTLRSHGLRSPFLWIDVEASSSRPWTGNKAWNRAVLSAWVRAYREAGLGVGVYSSEAIWHSIMGGHRPGLPEWRTAGPASSDAARGECVARSFQGGSGVIAQWWGPHRDFDLICPRYRGDRAMRAFFVKL